MKCNPAATSESNFHSTMYYSSTFQGQFNGENKDWQAYNETLYGLKAAFPVIDVQYETLSGVGREVAAVEKLRLVNALGEEKRAISVVLAQFGEIGSSDERKIVKSHEVFRLL